MKSRDYISNRTVLKRTHSKSGNHIIFLQDVLGKRTWEYMDAHSEIPRCRWFSQTYVLLLNDYGEWWVVIVGGAPAYTIHMQLASGDRWKYRNTTAFWPLHKLWCVNTPSVAKNPSVMPFNWVAVLTSPIQKAAQWQNAPWQRKTFMYSFNRHMTNCTI